MSPAIADVAASISRSAVARSVCDGGAWALGYVAGL